MSKLIDQVREGLEEKVRGLESAISYVKDEKELDRLNNELAGASAALSKLNEPVKRSEEEIKELEKMLDSSSKIDTSALTFENMSSMDKFFYNVEIYRKKLVEAREAAVNQSKVFQTIMSILRSDIYQEGVDCDHFERVKPTLETFEKSNFEVSYSINKIDRQLSLADEIDCISKDEDFFNKLSKLNEFLNNPMGLTHLYELEDKAFKEFDEMMHSNKGDEYAN